MSISRRAFFTRLAALFGAASITDLRKTIEDRGRPLLLAPPAPTKTLHVYEGGYLTLGPEALDNDLVRPTWREVLRVEGVAVDDPAALRAHMRRVSLMPEELDAPVSDVCWPMVYDMSWRAAARAFAYLARLDIGPRFTSRAGAGRLAFHEADNHPGSSELWVDVADDLSASLLQARLIELGEPVRVVMETPTIRRDDAEAGFRR